MTWEVFGHDYIKKILERQLETGQLAHAYLFFGPEGLGKKQLALDFAKKILNAESLETHPDFSLVDGSAKEGASVETARQLTNVLSTRPFYRGRKIVVIDDAHQLNLSSLNALLKTLEEPPEFAVIVLIANRGLLPTIVSRCQVFRFNRFSQAQLAALVQQRGLAVTEEHLKLSFGSPARLIRLLVDKEFLAAEQQALADFFAISNLSKGERLVKIAEYADRESSELEKLFVAWTHQAISQLQEQPELRRVIAGLQVAQRQLRTNKNKKLILQSVFLKI